MDRSIILLSYFVKFFFAFAEEKLLAGEGRKCSRISKGRGAKMCPSSGTLRMFHFRLFSWTSEKNIRTHIPQNIEKSGYTDSAYNTGFTFPSLENFED